MFLWEVIRPDEAKAPEVSRNFFARASLAGLFRNSFRDFWWFFWLAGSSVQILDNFIRR